MKVRLKPDTTYDTEVETDLEREESHPKRPLAMPFLGQVARSRLEEIAQRHEAGQSRGGARNDHRQPGQPVLGHPVGHREQRFVGHGDDRIAVEPALKPVRRTLLQKPLQLFGRDHALKRPAVADDRKPTLPELSVQLNGR